MKNLFFTELAAVRHLPLYAVAVGENSSQEKIVRKNGYPAYHIMLCEKGEGVLELDGKSYNIDENSFFILKPGEPHSYYSPKGNWHTKWIVFDGNMAEDIMKAFKLNDVVVQKISSKGSCYSNFNMLFSLAHSGDTDSAYKASAALYSTLLDIANMLQGNEVDTGDKISMTIKYIRDNYNKNVGLYDMAQFLGVSKQYLCRAFKNVMNSSPYDYLIMYRLKKAKEFLGERDIRLCDIARRAGFNDTSYFCYVFKKHEKLTPYEFRKQFYNL